MTHAPRSGFVARPGFDRGRCGHLPRFRRLVVVVAVLAACQLRDPAAGTSEPEPFPSDERLLDADRAFARASEERGADAWADVWAERGVLDRGADAPAVGPDEVRQAVAATAERLRWRPASSGVLWPDSLGYTVGRWWMEPVESGGAADTLRYLTVWQRSGDAWKVALDAALPAGDMVRGARAFDFWLGDWALEQRIWSGQGDAFEDYGGSSRVRAVEGGGALAESFHGVVRFFWSGMERPQRIWGASVRMYDPALSEWRIYWMDTTSRSFDRPFRGGFRGSEGEFTVADEAAGRARRIRFQPVADDAVDWTLELRSGDQDAWRSLWEIDFRR